MALAGAPSASHAAPDQSPSTADCDAAASARVLVPARWRGDARAYWLDAGRVRWPGMARENRYRLYHSADGRLDASIGAPVQGADEALALSPSNALPHAVRERFAFTGGGVELALARRDASRLSGLLRGQLLLVREDAQGRVQDATALQTSGALDDLYAAADGIDALGVSISAQDTRWMLWAPTARAVSLCLYASGDGPATSVEPMVRDGATGAWSLRAARDHSGAYYTYLLDVFVPGTGVVRNRVTDPYSIGLTTDSVRSYVADLDAPALKPEGWDDTPRPAPLASATDMAIYELHVRDFSRDDASVPAAHRGKYLGFTHPDSDGMRHLRALRAAGMTDVHLLPVFDLASVPESDCTAPRIPRAAADSDAQQSAVLRTAARDCYNWGYDPFHFNAPEGSYASDARDAAVRIREFRAMVMALHVAGLRVGMDVVYNHTTTSGQDPKSVLDRIVPGYYHRLDAWGAVERSTCCENTATEHRMMGKLMRDSVALWARHYRIDSFRFDLMGHQPRAEMERLRREVDTAAGRHVELIGEGWNFGEVADGKRFVQATQRSLNGSGIGSFSDRARDSIRGGGPADRGEALVAEKGYVNGLAEAPFDSGAARLRSGRTEFSNRPRKVQSKDAARPERSAAGAKSKDAARDDAYDRLLNAADLVRVGLAGTLRNYRMTDARGRDVTLSQIDYKGQPAGYASEPGEVVNYVENHDNQTLFDINAWKLPRDTTSEDRARVQVLALALNAFSQGIAYFHAGGELLRSKSLDRNSFDSGDWFNRIDWTFTDNGFGAGLPPRQDNEGSWPLMAPRLADPALKPTAAEIAWTRDAFLDLLRIRSSTTLLRLRSAEDIAGRLRFLNTGPAEGAVVGAHIDGRGYPGAGFSRLAYLINADTVAHRIAAPELTGQALTLHPVLAARGAADRRATQATWDARSATFSVPARTAVVFVAE